jgi:hypothetical protein
VRVFKRCDLGLTRGRSFKLSVLDVLVFKRLALEDISRLKAEVTEEVLPDDVFGTDPSGIEMTVDPAYNLKVAGSPCTCWLWLWLYV